MSTTFSGAIDNVYGRLAANPTERSSAPVASLVNLVTVVYDHEPGPSMAQKPVSVTVCPGGISPTEWIVVVRVYVSSDAPHRQQQDQIAAVTTAVDDLMVDGPSEWRIDYADALQCWVAACPLQVGREDF